MRQLTQRQSNQSKNAQIVKYYYRWQILKPSGKGKAKRSFTFTVITPKGIKMNCHAFVSIDHMRAGHSSLKASLSTFNIVSTAECKCGDGLQTEEHVFCDCKLCKDQKATMMDSLSENSKKEYPKSVTELLWPEKKRFVQRVLLHEQNS
jgi:GH18 family chitinase